MEMNIYGRAIDPALPPVEAVLQRANAYYQAEAAEGFTIPRQTVLKDAILSATYMGLTKKQLQAEADAVLQKWGVDVLAIV